MPEISSVADIVRHNAQVRPDRIALIDGERTRTWSELFDRSARAAQALAAAGVSAGDRVVFFDKNSIEHFEVFFGAAMLNAVCVDPNWRLAAPEVQFIIDDTDAKVLVYHSEFDQVLEVIGDQLPQVTTFVRIGSLAPGHGEGGQRDRHVPYEQWITAHDPVDPQAPSSGADVAFQLYSSGTTGRPKGVMITNDNFLALLPLATGIWELTSESVNLAAMPLFHIGGGGWATAGMYLGATTVLMRDLDPMALAGLIERHQVTHAFLVPAVLTFMLLNPDLSSSQLASMEVVLYGASPISEEVLAKSLQLWGCKFWQAYGLTETTGAIVNLPPDDHDPAGPNAHRLRSCGLPGPGVELRIVAADPDGGGTDVPTGEVGEIWIRSAQVMLGYWKRPDDTDKAIVDGWFRSGDVGFLDADGYLYIHDRIKDMIVSGGENVYPAEVENALMAHPRVADVAVIGVPDDKWGEVPKAIIVATDGPPPEVSDIISFARERLAGFKVPKSIEFVEALPRNPTGKILKQELRAPYWEGRDRAVN
jgi:long-chain acyl-CoA synthetase